MKLQFLTLATAAAALAAALLATQPASHGQAGNSPDEAALVALATEVAAQQNQIAANQTKIDERIAQIAEEVRQARLFVARGGGAKK